MQRGAHAYFQTQVTTTSQGEIVVMLYDAAIKFMNQAKDMLAKNDMAGKGIAISKALDIINELSSTLNMEKGGTLASNLQGLYTFSTGRLAQANLKKDPGMVDDVLKIFAGLRSAYAQVLDEPEAKAAALEAAESRQIDRSTRFAAGGQANTGTEGGPQTGSLRQQQAYAKQMAESQAEAEAEAARISGEEEELNASPAGAPPSVPAPEKAPERAEAPAQTAAEEAAETPGFFRAAPSSMRKQADLYRKFSGQ